MTSLNFTVFPNEQNVGNTHPLPPDPTARLALLLFEVSKDLHECESNKSCILTPDGSNLIFYYSIFSLAYFQRGVEYNPNGFIFLLGSEGTVWGVKINVTSVPGYL